MLFFQIVSMGGMRKPQRLHATCAAMLLLASVCEPLLAGNDRIYIYQRPDGSRLITDHPNTDPSFRLVRRYGIHVPGGTGSHSAYNTSFKVATIRRGSRNYTPRPTTSEFDELIAQKSSQYGVDSALVKAVVQIESAYRAGAVSHKGATGLMQLMPATAARFGVRNRKNPGQNVDGGVRYLKHLLELFSNDIQLALAAYNAGENAVMRYDGIPPYQETIDYVDKVMTLHRLYAAN